MVRFPWEGLSCRKDFTAVLYIQNYGASMKTHDDNRSKLIAGTSPRTVCNADESETTDLFRISCRLSPIELHIVREVWVSSCFVSTVAIAGGTYGLVGPGSIPGIGKIFLSPQGPGRLWGTPSLLSSEYQSEISPGIKWSGREADHSPPSFDEVKNGGAIHPLPHMSSWHRAW
jgi:hypothetical protein